MRKSLLISLLLTIVTLCSAQTDTGTILGIVSDSSGGALPRLTGPDMPGLSGKIMVSSLIEWHGGMEHGRRGAMPRCR